MKNVFLLAVVAIFSLFCPSCGKKSVVEPEASVAPSAEEILRREQEALRREKRAYAEHVKDSLLTAYGYDANKAYPDSYAHQEEIDRLENYSQASLMADKIAHKNEEIRARYSKKVSDEIGKYGISVATDDGEASSSAFGIIYGWAKDERGNQADRIQGLERYGESRQKEIKDKVLGLLTQMEKEQEEASSAITKTFSDYYPILDLGKLPKEYASYFKEEDIFLEEAGEGSTEFSYEAVSSKKFLQVARSIRVYDSKLPVDFFGEPGAAYKLDKVGEGKWQIAKTKNGKTSKSQVFSHNVDYRIDGMISSSEEFLWKDDFSYSPGANMGVEVWVTEILFTRSPNKSDKYPDSDGKIAARLRSSQEKLRKGQEESDKHNALHAQADSVSKKMLREKYGD